MQVEKIHDLRRHLYDMEPITHPSRHIVGVLNARVTRLLCFLVISLSLLGCMVACLLAVWQYVAPEIAWRALASLGIISAAAAVFVALNEGFGPAIRG